jgi:hypothetical protein
MELNFTFIPSAPDAQLNHFEALKQMITVYYTGGSKHFSRPYDIDDFGLPVLSQAIQTPHSSLLPGKHPIFSSEGWTLPASSFGGMELQASEAYEPESCDKDPKIFRF